MLCVSIQERTVEGCLSILSRCQMAELRIDLCGFGEAEVREVVSRHPNILATCRVANGSEEYTVKMLKAAIDAGATMVDLEIEASSDIISQVGRYAHEKGVKFIVSYHNFEITPSIEELRSIVNSCYSLGADIAKVVTTAHNLSDSSRVLKLYDTHDIDGRELVAFAMGEEGKCSRYISLKLGAPYTYVSSGEGSATASGQYTLSEMERLLSQGEYNIKSILGGASSSLPDSVTIPCSKSVAQRAVIAAAFAKGTTTLKNYEPCNDIEGALAVVREMGCDVVECGDEIVINSPGASSIKESFPDGIDLSVGESGLLTRLLLPFVSYISSGSVNGKGSLLGRDISSAADAMRKAGVEVECRNGKYLPFRIKAGELNSHISFSGKDSSQIVSGFLMSLPLFSRDSILEIHTPTSIPYIELTINVMRQFGVDVDVKVESDNMTFYIKGGQQYNPLEINLDSDWSSASYFAAAYAIDSLKSSKEYTLKNMTIGSSQADEVIIELLRECGAVLIKEPIEGNSNGENMSSLSNLRFNPLCTLKSFDFDATHSPDLFPTLAALACFCDGVSRIKGVSRLAQKESNRAEAILVEFTMLGAKVEIEDDYMYISWRSNGDSLDSIPLHSHNDHRMAMSLILAASLKGIEATLDDIDCIDKSFPSFLKRYYSN